MVQDAGNRGLAEKILKVCSSKSLYNMSLMLGHILVKLSPNVNHLKLSSSSADLKLEYSIVVFELQSRRYLGN